MDLMQRRRQLMAMHSELPSAYRRVEYLESNRYQHIITDIYTSTSVPTTYEATVGYWVSDGRRQLIGADYGAYFGVSAGNRYEIGTGSNIIPSSDGYDVIIFKQDIVEAKQILIVNGISYTRKYSNWGSNQVVLFNITDAPVSFGCKCRIKSFRIKQGGAVSANFVPCVRKSDNKPGMYDAISKTFYTNAGTGEFIVPA